jgi:hypothetical protein
MLTRVDSSRQASLCLTGVILTRRCSCHRSGYSRRPCVARLAKAAAKRCLLDFGGRGRKALRRDAEFVMRRARPSSIYEGLQGFSFPSNHATLSVVTYGFLAFLVARALGQCRTATHRDCHDSVHSPHFVFTPLPGCPLVLRCARGSQLRRGMDSDSGRASSRWRRKSNRRVFARCVAPFVTFVTSATVHIVMQHAFDLSLYAPR